jgi:hypothetical protein
MKCGYTLCRYNKDKDCTHEDKGAECHYVLKSVLDVNDGCEFCNKYHSPDGHTCGENIPVKPTVSSKKGLSLDGAEVHISPKEEPCIMLYNFHLTAGYIDIKYCPMCGRKLTYKETDIKEMATEE